MKTMEGGHKIWPKHSIGRFLDLPATLPARNFCTTKKMLILTNEKLTPPLYFFQKKFFVKIFIFFIQGKNICLYTSNHFYTTTCQYRVFLKNVRHAGSKKRFFLRFWLKIPYKCKKSVFWTQRVAHFLEILDTD